jgi:alkylated DNA nucleotide flippase Atl1
MNFYIENWLSLEQDNVRPILKQYAEHLDTVRYLYEDQLMTYDEIAEQIGLPSHVVKRIVRSMDIRRITPAERARRKRQRDFELVYRLHIEKRMTFAEISKIIGRSAPYIAAVLKENGVQPRNYGQQQWRSNPASTASN